MTTCCPNCSSTSAIGTDVASACADCASVSVAGASISLPIAIAVGGGILAAVFIARLIRRGLTSRVLLTNQLSTNQVV